MLNINGVHETDVRSYYYDESKVASVYHFMPRVASRFVAIISLSVSSICYGYNLPAALQLGTSTAQLEAVDCASADADTQFEALLVLAADDESGAAEQSSV